MTELFLSTKMFVLDDLTCVARPDDVLVRICVDADGFSWMLTQSGRTQKFHPDCFKMNEQSSTRPGLVGLSRDDKR